MVKRSIFHLLKIPLIQTILIFTVVFGFATPIFQQVDDVHIARMLSGAFTGAPTPYVFAIHIIPSSLLAYLYSVVPQVNWYSVMLYTALFLSLYAMGVAFKIPLSRRSIIAYVAVVFMVLIYVHALIQLQYVTVAGLCVFSGLLLFLSSACRNEVTLKVFFLSLILIIVGYVLRERVVYMAFLITLPAIFYVYPSIEESTKKRFTNFFLTLVLAVAALYACHAIVYKINPMLKNDHAFFESHIDFSSFYIYHHIFNEDVYRSVGWSANDYRMFDSWSYESATIFPQWKIAAIMAAIIQQPPSGEQIDAVYRAALANFTQSGGMYLVTAYGLVLTYLIFFGRERRMLIFTLAAFAFIYLVFSYLIRYMPYRISMPIALYLGTICALLSREVTPLRQTKTLIAFCALVACLLVAATVELYHATWANPERIAKFKQMVNLLPTKKDAVIFVTGSSIPFYWTSTFDDFSLLKKYALAGGGWPQRLYPQRQLLRQYNANNLYQDLYIRDNVLLVATDDQLNAYKIFMEEHYDVQTEYYVLRDLSRYEMEKSRYDYGGKLVKIVRTN